MRIVIEPEARDWIRKKGAGELQIQEAAAAGGVGCCSAMITELLAVIGRPEDGRPYCPVECEGISFYVPEHLHKRYSELRIFMQDLMFFKSLKAVGIE